MKIIFAIKRLEKMAGGAERVILQIIDGLRQEYGHDIILITFDQQGAESFYPMPNGLQWIRLGIGDSAKRAGIMETIKRIFALRRAIKSIHPDYIVPFQHSMFVPMVLATFGLGKPIIASEHTVPTHYKKHPLEYFLLIGTGLLCKRITVLSQAIISMYPTILRSRMVAIPNPVATSDIPADVIGRIQKTLLSVGRLSSEKNQATLINAFSLIADRFPDWNLKIIGEGQLRSNLERQIQSLGLTDRVVLAGATNNILTEYQSAQAFVLASQYEGFGLATAEAMSAGLPVVGFADCIGTNQLIQDGKTGILVKTDGAIHRTEALSQSLSKIMGDARLRAALGQEGRHYMQSYSTKTVIKIWDSLLTTSS